MFSGLELFFSEPGWGCIVAILIVIIYYFYFKPKEDQKNKNAPLKVVAPQTLVEKPKNKTFSILCIAIFIVNIIISCYYLTLVDYEIGWQAYTALFRVFEIGFSFVVCSISLVSILANFNIKSDFSTKKNTVIFFSTLLFSVGVHFFVCASPYLKYKMTDSRIINEQDQQSERKLKEIDKLLAEKKLHFAPTHALKLADSRLIMELFYREINNFYSPLLKTKPAADSIFNRINRLLLMNFSSIPEKTIIDRYRNSFRIDYIIYSPNYQKFIAIGTLDFNFSKTNRYGYLIFLCHREKTNINAIVFSDSNDQYYERGNSLIDGLSALYRDYPENHPLYSDEYRFGKTTLHLKYSELPYNESFWIAPNVIKFCRCTKDTAFKYKGGIDYTNKQPYFYELAVSVY